MGFFDELRCLHETVGAASESDETNNQWDALNGLHGDYCERVDGRSVEIDMREKSFQSAWDMQVEN